ncbi:MAG: TetR/AcrR family transcriptional regulator [Lentisphaeria bacterium]|nr:TetR/AcrR family transcriptional regulator [Lentisphaeria bacterium]
MDARTDLPDSEAKRPAAEDAAAPCGRRERERLRHRREIVEAAERVFVRKGSQGATVEEIAQEAEFAVGTIYNFFASKDVLYTEVILRIAENFFEAFQNEVLETPDPVAAVRALVELRLRHFEQHRGFFRMVFDNVACSRMDPARTLPDICRPLFDRYLESVKGIFARGIAAGRFEPADPLHLTLCVDGITNAFVGYWSRAEAPCPDQERTEDVVRTVLKAVGAQAD